MGLPEGLDAWVSGSSSIPSDFVGIECRAKPEIGSTRVLPRESRGRRIALTVGRQNGSVELGPVFWRLWTSTASSNLGDGIGKTGFPLLAVLLTRDPIQVSLLTAAFFLPWLVFALPSGAIIDRVDRSRAMTLASAGRPGRLADRGVRDDPARVSRRRRRRGDVRFDRAARRPRRGSGPAPRLRLAADGSCSELILAVPSPAPSRILMVWAHGTDLLG